MAKRKKKKAFVLDGSIALAWCFPDEKAAYSQAVLDSLTSASAFAPSLWRLEVGNALLMGERRGRVTQADTAKWTTYLNALPVTIDDETDLRAWSETLTLARTQDLTVYDAAYLELALRRGVPLATLDAQLKAAAASVGVAEYIPS